MKIIINIPNNYHVGMGAEILIDAVVDGIEIPKEHGDLIDRDDMISHLKHQCEQVFKLDAVKPEDYYIAKDAKFMQATWKNWCESFYKYVNARPTVIKSDKE